jgi:DNA gyrase inhibitor GyrI
LARAVGGEALREAPILLNYLDDPETTPEAALRTDLHLPLA